MIEDSENWKLRLLSSIDLNDVVATAVEIITQLTESPNLAVLMWDSDLDSFGEKFLFGPKSKELAKACELFLQEELASEDLFEEIELAGQVSKDISPLYCYKVKNGNALCACILICAAGELDREQVLPKLQEFSLSTALSNAWEYKELKRENERLRSQYEEMEDKTSMLEGETRKLIHDMTARETMRTRQVERERLIYWISNAVRSSVHIQQVLETTVEKIGTNIGVSRCLLLRSADALEGMQVYEFAQESASSVKQLFSTETGYEFTRLALARTTPQVLEDPALGGLSGYNQEFVSQLGIRSGLIVPLIMRERALGVLFLQDCWQSRQWSIDDISFFGSLADNLSVAIENAELHQERERQAVTDGLTGVANRRKFTETLNREFERARRYEQPLSLVVIDLDHLKKINDTFGHQIGDEAIRVIGATLRQSSRSVDLPARYGGEEFCLLLPNTDLVMAHEMAERVRRLINDVEIEGIGKITASLGVANYPLHADDPELLFQRADEALYAAKQGGRNQVVVADSTKVSEPKSSSRETGGPIQANQS